MKQAGTRELFNYWNRLRRDRAAPERTEIDPAAIRKVLADTFILEVDAERRFPLRLSGTRVNALFDAEQKGRSFIDLWAAHDARALRAMLLTVVDGACPIVAGAVCGPHGHPEVELELVFLPLRHHGKTHARVLGLIAPARRPSWLGLLPVEPITLRSMRVVGAETTDLVAAPARLAAGLALVPPVPGSEVQRRGHLRVYPGGRRSGFLG